MLKWDAVRLHSAAWVGDPYAGFPLAIGGWCRIPLFTLQEEFHKIVPRKLERRLVIVGVWIRPTAELVDMNAFARDKGFKFTLSTIDVFSKNDWLVLLKHNTGARGGCLTKALRGAHV